jgi:hypothetical protein
MPIRHRYWAVTAAVLFLLVLALVGSRFVSPRYRISKETTYLVEPLTHGGNRVDYWSAIHEATRPDDLASEENGYRLLIQKLGRSPDGDPESFSKLCELLGLAPDSIRPEIAFVEPQDFIKAYVESDDFDDSWLDELPDGDEFEFWPEDESEKRRRVERLLEARLNSPWNLDNLPMMARWLEENNAALDLMDQATRRSTFLIPVVTRDDETVAISAFDVHEFARMRTFSRGLKARANFRIGTGDLDGAIDDIVTLKRLARHLCRFPYAMSQLIGISIEGAASAIGISGALEHPPTTEQLERLRVSVADSAPDPDWNVMLRIERLVMLDFLQALAHGEDVWHEFPSLRSLDVPPRPFSFARPFDWNVVAKRFNDHVDTALIAIQQRTERTSPDTALQWLTGERLRDAAVHEQPELLADALAEYMFLSWSATQNASQRHRCGNQLHQIVLAMLSYERDHGTLPPAYSVDADGTPLHSWRVHLLPYLGHAALYDKIRLDEPWDSPHNQKFHGEPLTIFRCPADPKARPGKTTYSVVVGPDMPFEAGRGKSLADFGPTSDEMILVVERGDPIGWMEPTREVTQSAAEKGIHHEEVPWEEGSAQSEGIQSPHRGVVIVGIRNGSIRGLPKTIYLETFHKMLRGAQFDRYSY